MIRIKKWWYPLSIGVLTIALIWTAYWGYLQNKEKHELMVLQEGVYQRAFYDLISSMHNVENALSKVLAAGTREFEQAQLVTAWQQAHLTQRDLAQLPLGRSPLIETQKFLNQLGDYCFVLANGDNQEVIEDIDREQIKKLYHQAKNLSEQLQKMVINLGEERFPWSKIALSKEKDWSSSTRALPDTTFANLEEQLQTFPQLIYDGPFSEQVINQKINLQGKSITKEDAESIARDFLGLGDDKRFIIRITETDEQSPLHVYSVRIIPIFGNIGDQIVMDITKTGGHVAWMLNNRGVGGSDLTLEDAQNRAEEFLEAKGYQDFIPTGVIRTFNQAVVSFAEIQDNMVIYPHLIKVKVALDSGEITGFESINYLMTNKKRHWPANGISIEEALERLNLNLEIEKIRKAVIPLNNGKEAICWEFMGIINNETFLVYIDAVQGTERNILKYIETENGILTM